MEKTYSCFTEMYELKTVPIMVYELRNESFYEFQFRFDGKKIPKGPSYK